MYSPKAEALRILGLGFTAALHKMQRPGLEGYKNLENLATEGCLSAGRGKVFISHASADAKLVRALEALLHAGSPLERCEQFFCSVSALEGPRPFEHLRRTIWESLRAAEYVVFVATQAFMESRECAYELGATAALGIPSIAPVAPGIEFQDNQIPVVDRAGGRLNERSALAKVWSCLKGTYGYDHVAPERFEELQQDVVDLAGAFGRTPDLLAEFATDRTNLDFRRLGGGAR